MSIGTFARRWLPAILLAAVALVAWRASERRDTDMVSTERVVYERELVTPLLSARRAPRTIQAPVVDAAIAPTLRRLITDSPDASCLVAQVGDRMLVPSARVDRALVPASNQKLLATYAALLTLGEGFTFTTEILADTEPIGGTIEGNLYLVGSGDPFLSTENWWTQYDETSVRHHTRLEDLADRIVDAGVTDVTGTVVGDESLFDANRQGPWDERLISGQQSGPLSALTVNEGFVDWPEEFVTPRQRSPAEDPPVHAASILIQLLSERGVTIAEPPQSGRAPVTAFGVTSIESPPLIDLVAHINSYSSNLGAELLLKRLGVATSGAGTTAAGTAAVIEALVAAQIPVDGLRVADGSGLAESNLLTCRALAAVLADAGPDSAFAAGLAIAGVRGTLSERMVDTPAVGAVFAKTGTLNGATALSGYIRSANDPDVSVIFAYVANGDFIGTDDELRNLQNEFGAAMTAYPGPPAIDDLDPIAPTAP